MIVMIMIIIMSIMIIMTIIVIIVIIMIIRRCTGPLNTTYVQAWPFSAQIASREKFERASMGTVLLVLLVKC